MLKMAKATILGSPLDWLGLLSCWSVSASCWSLEICWRAGYMISLVYLWICWWADCSRYSKPRLRAARDTTRTVRTCTANNFVFYWS